MAGVRAEGALFLFGGGELINDVLIWLKTMYTIGELKILAAGSVIGACFSFAIGGVDKQVLALFGFAVADYITGWAAASRREEISSRKGYRGMQKKIAMFAAVAVAYWADVAMGTNTLRSMALFGFAVVEVTSLLENIDRLGYGRYIPTFLRNKLIQIREEKGVNL